jgi:hypothetical protein
VNNITKETLMKFHIKFFDGQIITLDTLTGYRRAFQFYKKQIIDSWLEFCEV